VLSQDVVEEHFSQPSVAILYLTDAQTKQAETGGLGDIQVETDFVLIFDGRWAS
jgi:hypothetical protein